MLSTCLVEEALLISQTKGDPGLVSGCRHQLRSDLHQRVLQPVQLELPHQHAEQHGCHGVGEPFRGQTQHRYCCRTPAEDTVSRWLPELRTRLAARESEEMEALLH